ncbi:MAG: tRNA (guanosine(37)-N1)-methyltransferase TrmD [Candidatus Kapaibacteriota bacterium]
MRIDIVAAIPESIKDYLNYSILKIAQEKNLVEIYLHNLHDYSDNKYRRIDDYPFGGDAGMLIKCEPIFKCIEKLKSERDYDEIIFLTPDGELFNQSIANELSIKSNIILLAGHYKGIDQRVRDVLISKEISIGNYVLTGGELAALVVMDAVVRLIPGTIGDANSALNDSFQNGLLEPPMYTRPENFQGLQVPQILLSGNHKKIEEWKFEKSLEKTKKLRPDMLKDWF